MGYSEARCTICGVSFNIGRVRRSDEPWTSAWAEYGFSNVCNMSGGCKKSAGCTFRDVPSDEMEIREKWEEGELPGEIFARFLRGFVLGGGDLKGKVNEEKGGEEGWIKRSVKRIQGVEEEVEEGEGEEGEGEGDRDEEIDGEEEGDLDEEEANDAAEGTGANADVEGINALDLPQEVAAGEDENDVVMATDAGPDEGKDQDEQEDDAEAGDNAEDKDSDMSECDDDEAEHIAGPGCRHANGYNGHRITVEEMFFSRTVQCLCRKLDQEPTFSGRDFGPFKPAADDEDFELNSDFFLSGLSDNPGEREDGGPRDFYPIRHGAEHPQGEDIAWEHDTEEYCPVFHPSCFELFKLASVAKLGHVDVEGFMCRWYLEGENSNDTSTLFQDPNVALNSEQWWGHEAGTEYLAASPLYMRTLNTILNNCTILASNTTFNIRNGAFPVNEPLVSNPSDPFNVLPNELRQHILSFLPSKDIASLRLACRSYRQLPISTFYHLLRREKPSLFEIVPETPSLSKWTKNRARDLRMEGAMIHKGRKAMEGFLEELGQEWEGVDVAGIMKEWSDEKIQGWLEESEHIRPPVEDLRLERERTDWFKVYTLISRAERKGELKGLRNRERVWKDCVEILKRVARYRVEGRIPFTKSLAEVMKER